MNCFYKHEEPKFSSVRGCQSWRFYVIYREWGASTGFSIVRRDFFENCKRFSSFVNLRRKSRNFCVTELKHSCQCCEFIPILHVEKRLIYKKKRPPCQLWHIKCQKSGQTFGNLL